MTIEKELLDKLKRVFDIGKASMDTISDSKEQNCLFIEVQSSRYNYRDLKVTGRMSGLVTLFAPGDKLPFGYFAKRIQQADVDDTIDLFFYDLEENRLVMKNIVERTCRFVYFFNGQFDPEVGTITSITFEEGD